MYVSPHTRGRVSISQHPGGPRTQATLRRPLPPELWILLALSSSVLAVSAYVGKRWIGDRGESALWSAVIMTVLNAGVVGLVDGVASLEKRQKETQEKRSIGATRSRGVMLGIASGLRFVEILCLLRLFTGISALRVIILSQFMELASFASNLLSPLQVVFPLLLSFISTIYIEKVPLGLSLEVYTSLSVFIACVVFRKLVPPPGSPTQVGIGSGVIAVITIIVAKTLGLAATSPSLSILPVFIPITPSLIVTHYTARSLTPFLPSLRLVTTLFVSLSVLGALYGALAFRNTPNMVDIALFVSLLYALRGMTSPATPEKRRGSSHTYRTIKTYSSHILNHAESRRIFLFLIANLTFMFVQMLYGVWTNSLGLISDAIHMAFDCLSIALGLTAAVMAKWRPNERFTYGYGRLETLSGFANGIFLILISVFIVFEAIERLLEPPEMNTNQLLLVSTLGLLVNLFGMFATGGHHHHGHSHEGHDHGDMHPHSHDDDDHDHHGHGHGHGPPDHLHEVSHDHVHQHSEGSSGSEVHMNGHNALEGHTKHIHTNGHDHHHHGPGHEEHGVQCEHRDHHSDHHHDHEHAGHSHTHSNSYPVFQSEHDHHHDEHSDASPDAVDDDEATAVNDSPTPVRPHGHRPAALQLGFGMEQPSTILVNGETLDSPGPETGNGTLDTPIYLNSPVSPELHFIKTPATAIVKTERHGHKHSHSDHGHNHDHHHTRSHVHDHGHSHNMRGVFLHVMADTLGSVGVIISTLLIKFYGWTGFDPIASIFIAVLIVASVVPLVIDAGRVLALDVGPDREAEIRQALSELSSVEGLASYTAARFWPKDATTLIGTIHIQLAVSSSSRGDPGGPHSLERVAHSNVDRVVRRIENVLKSKLHGLEELGIQVEGNAGIPFCWVVGYCILFKAALMMVCLINDLYLRVRAWNVLRYQSFPYEPKKQAIREVLYPVLYRLYEDYCYFPDKPLMPSDF